MSDSNVGLEDLSPATLAALLEFFTEKEQERESRQKTATQVLDISFDEDWQLSQFWYDDDTTDSLVKVGLKCTEPDSKIALISCPTIYTKLKKCCGDRQVTLFEYDDRFKVFGTDFVHYNYKLPLDIPREMASNYDLVIADPPFLSDECLTKTAVTIKYLAKKNVILCTGAVMKELAERLLDVKKCIFIPHHKNNLANEFYCYSNFNFDEILK